MAAIYLIPITFQQTLTRMQFLNASVLKSPGYYVVIFLQKTGWFFHQFHQKYQQIKIYAFISDKNILRWLAAITYTCTFGHSI